MNKSNTRIAILGAGNIGSAIARGVMNTGLLPAAHITLTRRKIKNLDDLKRDGFVVTADNRAALKNADLVFISVTPQQLNSLLEEIRGVLDTRRHMIVSIVSGVTIGEIRTHLGKELAIVRAMPNLAIAIRESMTCLASDDVKSRALPVVKRIFDALGKTLVIDEGLMVPATALCACGIAFFLRAIRAASQGGIEIGFHAEDALQLAAQTARGAASLLAKVGNHPEREVDKVTTPQGCTIAGLNQMEHHGFSSALIRGIITSAEKAEALYAPKAK